MTTCLTGNCRHASLGTPPHSFLFFFTRHFPSLSGQTEAAEPADHPSTGNHRSVHDDQAQPPDGVAVQREASAAADGEATSGARRPLLRPLRRAIQDALSPLHAPDDRDWTHTPLALSGSQQAGPALQVTNDSRPLKQRQRARGACGRQASNDIAVPETNEIRKKTRVTQETRG